jgi:hypothetical protein
MLPILESVLTGCLWLRKPTLVTLHPCGTAGSSGGSSGSKYGEIPARCCRGSNEKAARTGNAKLKALRVADDDSILEYKMWLLQKTSAAGSQIHICGSALFQALMMARFLSVDRRARFSTWLIDKQNDVWGCPNAGTRSKNRQKLIVYAAIKNLSLTKLDTSKCFVSLLLGRGQTRIFF